MSAAAIDRAALVAIAVGMAIAIGAAVSAWQAKRAAVRRDKDAAVRTIVAAVDGGTTPTFASFRRPETGEPTGPPGYEYNWCAEFELDGCEVAAFGFGDDQQCVIQVRTPQAPELRITPKDAPTSPPFSSRLERLDGLGLRGFQEKYAVWAADEQFATDVQYAVCIDPSGALPSRRLAQTTFPDSRPRAIALADSVASIEFAADNAVTMVEYADCLIDALRRCPDTAWHAAGRPSNEHGTSDAFQRPFRPRPTARNRALMTLAAIGIAPLLVAFAAFGLVNVVNASAHLAGAADLSLFTGHRTPALFGGSFADGFSHGLAAGWGLAIGVAILSLLAWLLVKISRARRPAEPGQPSRLSSRWMAAFAAAYGCGVLVLVLSGLTLPEVTGIGLALVIAVAFAVLIWFATRGYYRGKKQLDVPLTPGRFAAATAFAVPGSFALANPILYAAGLAHAVELTVTNVRTELVGGSSDSAPGRATLVTGHYQVDGQPQTLSDATWSGAQRPRTGDVVDIVLGPLWPHTVMTTGWVAFYVTVAGLVLLTFGAGFIAVLLQPQTGKRSA